MMRNSFKRVYRKFRGKNNVFHVNEPVVRYPRVDLCYWSPVNGVNFGDYLSRTVVELLLAQRGITLTDEVLQSRQLLAIGSILHFARDNAVVWGSGLNAKVCNGAIGARSLDVRAVRGPLTREALIRKGIHVPEVYGDPGLLVRSLTGDRFVTSERSSVVFVPNLNDVSQLPQISDESVKIVLPTQSWNRCVADIAKASFVISSSLHGIVIAEAFGIPARYLRLSDQEHMFKFEDYYLGSGRSGFQAARSVSNALDLGGEAPPVFDPEELVDAFPYDLWNARALGHRYGSKPAGVRTASTMIERKT